MIFFSHPLYFCLSLLSEIGNRPTITVYLFRLEISISPPEIPLKTVLVSSYFVSHPITVVLEIFGGRVRGPSPPQSLGAVPPSLSRLRLGYEY